ncbi:hypothetical protein [Pelomonas sp. KK5]|uniref:hypothetical protein n=1 Tax=Pelomonas sp. KK5 TaxID=1855730 RepID=UPI00117F62DD|nr:hypothetical protein [Pelomonas sp. KK5]
MATPDPINFMLKPLPRAQLGTLAELLPGNVAIIEPLRVVSLRCLPGGEGELAAAAGALPGPGRFSGGGTQDTSLLAWRSPSEWLHVGTHDAPADGLLDALKASPAQAIDISAGVIVFELRSLALDALLPRLLDAGVPLGQPGQAARTRLADVAVLAMRVAPQRLWLLADRANDHYLAHWLAYASAALPQ